MPEQVTVLVVGANTKIDNSGTETGEESVDLIIFPSWSGEGILSPGRTREKLAAAGEAARANQAYCAVHGWTAQNTGRSVSRGWLLSPNGAVCFSQDETQVKKDGLKRGDSLNVADTPFAKIGFLIGQDAFVPEVGRILSLQGADMVIAYTFVELPGGIWRQLAGVWQQVQQNQFFGVESCFKGEKHDGIDAVHAPCEMTPGETGFLVREEQGNSFTVGLDFQQLYQVRRHYPLRSHLNLRCYRSQLTFYGGLPND